jgi:hypothetical protein
MAARMRACPTIRKIRTPPILPLKLSAEAPVRAISPTSSSLARWRIPARFVAGYRLADGSAEPGVHEWAEAYIPEPGWVAFDATVPICPDNRYVRIAIGFDGQTAR